MSELKVYAIAFGQRGTYHLQWKCPNTGRKKTRSTDIKITGRAKERTEATKAAAAMETKLRSNYTANTTAATWAAFRERYEKEVCSGKAPNTLIKVLGVFNAVERILNPQKLVDLTEERISYFTSELRIAKKAEASIKSTLAHLKASLRWAKKMKLLAEAPAIEMPTRGADKSKGRPITGEEFDRMIAAVPKVLKELHREKYTDHWQRLLRGLWLSGLRLGEALALTWDGDHSIRVDLSGRRPMLLIPAGCDKSNKERVLPMTPDFAELLLSTPEADRRGLVFPIPSRGVATMRKTRATRVVAKFGRAAGIKVATNATGKVRFASAHDLRRSFGERWAQRLLPQVLMELMRHSEISTTLTFYTGKNADRTSDAVYAAFEASQAKQLAKSAPESTPAETAGKSA